MVKCLLIDPPVVDEHLLWENRCSVRITAELISRRDIEDQDESLALVQGVVRGCVIGFIVPDQVFMVLSFFPLLVNPWTLLAPAWSSRQTLKV